MHNNLPLIGGIIGGIGCVFYTFIFYMVDLKLMLSPIVIWLGLVIYILPMYKAASTAIPEGTFSQRMQMRIRRAFIVFLVANIIYYVFYYCLFNFIDPGLVDMQYQILQERLENMGPGASQLKEIYKDTDPEDLRMTVGKTLFSFGRGLIGGFILSAIMAYILERL